MDGDNKIIAARLEQIRRENGLTLDASGKSVENNLYRHKNRPLESLRAPL